MEKYLVVIEKATNNYGAYSPDVLGCVAAGDTLEETLNLMRSGLEIHIQDSVERGESVPKFRGSQSYLDAVEMSEDGEYFITHVFVPTPHHQPV